MLEFILSRFYMLFFLLPGAMERSLLFVCVVFSDFFADCCKLIFVAYCSCAGLQFFIWHVGNKKNLALVILKHCRLEIHAAFCGIAPVETKVFLFQCAEALWSCWTELHVVLGGKSINICLSRNIYLRKSPSEWLVSGLSHQTDLENKSNPEIPVPYQKNQILI